MDLVAWLDYPAVFISGQGNRIGPVCLCFWVCGTFVVHHFNGTELRCECDVMTGRHVTSQHDITCQEDYEMHEEEGV